MWKFSCASRALALFETPFQNSWIRHYYVYMYSSQDIASIELCNFIIIS